MKNVFLKRPNYVVADLDNALLLYRDILGFELVYQKVSDQSSYSYAAFGIEPAASIRFAVLRTPTQDNAFALTEVKGHALATSQAPRDHAIVISVEDFDGTQALLRSAGYVMMAEGRLVTHTNATGREQAFLDADGHLVLIYVMD